jgi:Helix-hairpin-helix motif
VPSILEGAGVAGRHRTIPRSPLQERANRAELVGVRTVIHVATGLALAALAFAVGRWLRDPSPGGPLLILLGAALLWAVAARRLYSPGGLGRTPAEVVVAAPEPPPPPAEPPDDRIDLNLAGAADLQQLPGIGPVGARRIVEEREAGGPYRSVGDLVRVAGFGPSRVHGLSGRVRV